MRMAHYTQLANAYEQLKAESAIQKSQLEDQITKLQEATKNLQDRLQNEQDQTNTLKAAETEHANLISEMIKLVKRQKQQIKQNALELSQITKERAVNIAKPGASIREGELTKAARGCVKQNAASA
jgi:hypothetical protein